MQYYHKGNIKSVRQLRRDVNEVSFPTAGPTAQNLIDYDIIEVEERPTIDPDTQKIKEVSGSIVSGKWRNYEVVAKTSFEIWKEDMGKFRMTREIEEHYVNKHDGQTGDTYTQTILDAKVKRRGQRPDVE